MTWVYEECALQNSNANPQQNEDTLWRQQFVLRWCPFAESAATLWWIALAQKGFWSFLQKHFRVQFRLQMLRAGQNELAFEKHSRIRLPPQGVLVFPGPIRRTIWSLPLSLPRVINVKLPRCSLTRNITSHSMENLAFHSLLRWKMIILPTLTKSHIHFSLRRWLSPHAAGSARWWRRLPPFREKHLAGTMDTLCVLSSNYLLKNGRLQDPQSVVSHIRPIRYHIIFLSRFLRQQTAWQESFNLILDEDWEPW